MKNKEKDERSEMEIWWEKIKRRKGKSKEVGEDGKLDIYRDGHNE